MPKCIALRYAMPRLSGLVAGLGRILNHAIASAEQRVLPMRKQKYAVSALKRFLAKCAAR